MRKVPPGSGADEIDDYSADEILRPLVRSYNDLLTEYIARGNFPLFFHSREYF